MIFVRIIEMGAILVKRLFLGILVVSVVVSLLGCGISLTDNQPLMEIVGTVRWVELEGGFFGIVADDNTRYEPLNLPEAYQQDGLRVRLSARIRNDYASIFMWGTIIEILDIQSLD